ncbi:orotidine-5'-phosphate decarboxylase [Marinicella gelatinilytica]|uniref:orotidine-5'-phosphate decarboxylase n=1 Tax=Marinicella gelatinilytica TaxID=2996017 RepID=UPI0022608F6D|nr:orotidine-5'-phosphate decarboxylase [Marinicella gelatinilytica]MCX7546119.1 orotidine-5'-phosphate decarboxylase [Marinicella gelatinilytica]
MFIRQLEQRQQKANSLLCVGLDPQALKISSLNINLSDWLQAIVDATAKHACAFKPQIAHFSALAAEQQLHDIIEYIHLNYPDIPVILDSKRGDIGSTAERYAEEAFVRYQADALTVNPYLGGDTIEPYCQYTDKGVVVLCKTSNRESGQLQDLLLESGQPLYLHVAQLAAGQWNKNNNVLLVVGATYPEQLQAVREQVGNMPLLIPGIGAQGGDLAATLKAGLRNDGLGLIISASRSIIYAGDGADFSQQAGDAGQQLKSAINEIRESL